MPSLSKNEGHMDAMEFRSRWALGRARIAGSLARRLPEQGVKVAPAKAADLSRQPHPGCGGSFAAHGLTISEQKAKYINKCYTVDNKALKSDNAAYV
jgi:hypothetical protein